MSVLPLEDLARAAEAAADRARDEVLPRFRDVAVETKQDGSPVTEADRAAERAIRTVLREAAPDFGIVGEEYGEEGAREGPCWVVDPIDGTIAFSRGIPLHSTLIALVVEDEPVLGLIDLPALDDRTVGFAGGGVRRNGNPVRVSTRSDPSQAIISHGDGYAFESFGEHRAYERMAADLPMFRGYTDAFGHALVVQGAVDAMVDVGLNPWDVAATQCLAVEAGGRCLLLDRRAEGRKLGLVFGSPPLVDQLMEYFDESSPGNRSSGG